MASFYSFRENVAAGNPSLVIVFATSPLSKNKYFSSIILDCLCVSKDLIHRHLLHSNQTVITSHTVSFTISICLRQNLKLDEKYPRTGIPSLVCKQVSDGQNDQDKTPTVYCRFMVHLVCVFCLCVCCE